MAECDHEESRLISEEDRKRMHLSFLKEEIYDKDHRTEVYVHEKSCFLLDEDLCRKTESTLNYTDYCERQNRYIQKYDQVFRFNITPDEKPAEVLLHFLNNDIEEMDLEDTSGVFAQAHVDNTPLEKSFESLFQEAYGNDAVKYLQKEYAVSLEGGRNAFIDYVIETVHGNYAIEENGVHYHHPQLIGNNRYNEQLIKQDTLCLYGFKVYRFSSENVKFHDQTIDQIKKFLGPKEDFIEPHFLTADRTVHLYEHQERMLKEMQEARKNGETTSLIVCPTGSGKSQIILSDLEDLNKHHQIHRVLIMVPTRKIKDDWMMRIQPLQSDLEIHVELYNAVFLQRNALPADYYDYIAFDEAHHAQAANCRKTLQYFAPKYLIGMTATDERLDHKKLEEIFGHYHPQLSMQEAINKGVISNIRCFRLLSNIDLSNVRYNGKDYNYADLERTLVVESRNELIVTTIKKYFSPRTDFYKQGIVFCVSQDHAKKLAKMMNAAGLKAAAVYGGNKQNDRNFDDYRNKRIQFLTSCQMISEGWDSPQTEVIVMARPTLSKVVYLQQLGRGVRRYPGKECLYCIDVVDNYEGRLKPWNFNSLFHISEYSPFRGLIHNNHDYLSILGLHEEEIAMQEIDIGTFEEKYKGYLSPEQAARELFIGTASLMNWWRKDRTIASVVLPIGSRTVPYFSPKDIETIRTRKNLGIHNKDTIKDDFTDFIDENTLTFSFKLIFLINMFRLADSNGEVRMDALVQNYKAFYMDRIVKGLPVDRPNCVYTKEFLNDTTALKKNILSNPFEKFERKRFIYYAKDLAMLAFNPDLWEKMDDSYKNEIVEKEEKFLEEYYQKI